MLGKALASLSRNPLTTNDRGTPTSGDDNREPRMERYAAISVAIRRQGLLVWGRHVRALQY